MTDNDTTPARRTGPDVVTLSAGVLALTLSAYVLFGAVPGLPWLLAAGAIAVGVVMLIASGRSRS